MINADWAITYKIRFFLKKKNNASVVKIILMADALLLQNYLNFIFADFGFRFGAKPKSLPKMPKNNIFKQKCSH